MSLDAVVAATGNAHKLSEFREILDGSGIRVVSAAEAGFTGTVEETGDTLEANALLKARAVSEATGQAALADDTGLFVDALDGRPGVRSARYAGPAEDPAANRDKLLRELRDVDPEDRTAAFRAVIALVVPGVRERLFLGETRGVIITAPRGEGGFGYDPLFQPVPGDRTFAEMTPDEKHALSHRGQALRRLVTWLESRPEPRSVS